MRHLRRLLAIIIISCLVVGVYAAVKGFSGFDPLTLSRAKILAMVKTQGEQVLGVSVLQPISHAVGKPLPTQRPKQALLQIGLVADSHTDNSHLKAALAQIKAQHITTVIGLGDYTNVGTLQELQDTKAVFDQSGLTYYTVPGDHDLWDSRNKGQDPLANYITVFGKPYQTVSVQGVTLVLVDNADDYTGLSATEQAWLSNVLNQARDSRTICQKNTTESACMPVLVFLHEPLYNPTTAHVMGRVTASLDQQRQQLITQFSQAGVNEVISGDLHFFSQYTEPQTHQAMTTLGAITEARNLQTPRYAILTIFTDGSYAIGDKEISQ